MPFLGTLQADLIYEHWTDLKTPNSIDSIHINLIRSNQLRLDIYLIPFYIYTSHRSAYKNRKNYMLRIFSVSLVINRLNFSFFFHYFELHTSCRCWCFSSFTLWIITVKLKIQKNEETSFTFVSIRLFRCRLFFP